MKRQRQGLRSSKRMPKEQLATNLEEIPRRMQCRDAMQGVEKIVRNSYKGNTTYDTGADGKYHFIDDPDCAGPTTGQTTHGGGA